MREVVCRRYVLRLVKEALKAPNTVSESPRPSKRRKPNPHSADVLSPQRKSTRSNTPSTPKGRPKHDIESSDDDIKQEELPGSEPSTGKVIPQSIRCCTLICPTRQLEHRMPYLYKDGSHDKNKRPP